MFCHSIQCDVLSLYTKKKYNLEVSFKYSDSPIFKKAVKKAIKYLKE